MRNFIFLSFMLLFSATTHKAFACTTPTGLSVTVNGTSATISWSAVSGVSGYRVQVEDGTGNNVNYASASGTITTTSYTATGLIAGAAYKYKVRSICGGSTSSWSAWIPFNATGGGTGAAACSTLITGSTVSPATTTATISWPAVSGVTGYRVQVEDASGNNIDYLAVSGTITATTYTATGLVSGKAYKYKVRKVCGTSTSNWTAWKNFSTLSGLVSESSDVQETTADAWEAKVSPNPANGVVRIEVKNAEIAATSVRIFSVMGQLMHTESLASGNSQANINVADLPEGMYFLRVDNGSQSHTQQMVISR